MTPAVRCGECGAEIAPGLLACPGCARLVHVDALNALARSASAAERAGDRTTALAQLRQARDLLPQGSIQRAEVEARMAALSAAIDGRGASGSGNKKAAAGAAGAGAAGLALLKSKALLGALLADGKLLLAGLTKLPTLLSMLLYVHWTSGPGAGFALGLVASIYVHEVGHVAALKRYGIAASPPMFVPGFGALVRLKQYPTDAHEDARTGLAGPLWGLAAAAVAASVGAALGSDTALAVASVGASINLFNLVPVWQLDGARGLRALSRGERIAVGGVALVVAVAAHQWMPAAVGALALARAFGRDAHPTGDRRVLALFVTLVIVLALVAMLPADISPAL